MVSRADINLRPQLEAVQTNIQSPTNIVGDPMALQALNGLNQLGEQFKLFGNKVAAQAIAKEEAQTEYDQANGELDAMKYVNNGGILDDKVRNDLMSKRPGYQTSYLNAYASNSIAKARTQDLKRLAELQEAGDIEGILQFTPSNLQTTTEGLEGVDGLLQNPKNRLQFAKILAKENALTQEVNLKIEEAKTSAFKTKTFSQSDERLQATFEQNRLLGKSPVESLDAIADTYKMQSGVDKELATTKLGENMSLIMGQITDPDEFDNFMSNIQADRGNGVKSLVSRLDVKTQTTFMEKSKSTRNTLVGRKVDAEFDRIQQLAASGDTATARQLLESGAINKYTKTDDSGLKITEGSNPGRFYDALQIVEAAELRVSQENILKTTFEDRVFSGEVDPMNARALMKNPEESTNIIDYREGYLANVLTNINQSGVTMEELTTTVSSWGKDGTKPWNVFVSDVLRNSIKMNNGRPEINPEFGMFFDDFTKKASTYATDPTSMTAFLGSLSSENAELVESVFLNYQVTGDMANALQSVNSLNSQENKIAKDVFMKENPSISEDIVDALTNTGLIFDAEDDESRKLASIAAEKILKATNFSTLKNSDDLIKMARLKAKNLGVVRIEEGDSTNLFGSVGVVANDALVRIPYDFLVANPGLDFGSYLGEFVQKQGLSNVRYFIEGDRLIARRSGNRGFSKEWTLKEVFNIASAEKADKKKKEENRRSELLSNARPTNSKMSIPPPPPKQSPIDLAGVDIPAPPKMPGQ